MKISRKIVLKATISITLVFLSGCAADNPWVKMSAAQTSAHPTLNRALKNGEISSSWVSFTGSPSLAKTQKQNKEAEMEFFYQSVGPAPFIVGNYKTNVLHKDGGSGLRSTIALSQIATSAAFPDLGGGISAGGMALGIAGLLLSGGSSPAHLAGLDKFKNGQELYAVRFFPNKLAANKFIPTAAEIEAEVPAQFSGSIVGRTSWQNREATWEPYKTIIETGPGNSFELSYKMLPRPLPPESVDFAPVAVWDDCLRPIVKHGYAITDQWAIGTLSASEQESDARKLSKKYPAWTFVLARSASDKNINAKIPDPLICENGNCKPVAYKG